MVEMGDIGLDGEDENKQMEEQKPKWEKAVIQKRKKRLGIQKGK